MYNLKNPAEQVKTSEYYDLGSDNVRKVTATGCRSQEREITIHLYSPIGAKFCFVKRTQWSLPREQIVVKNTKIVNVSSYYLCNQNMNGFKYGEIHTNICYIMLHQSAILTERQNCMKGTLFLCQENKWEYQFRTIQQFQSKKKCEDANYIMQEYPRQQASVSRRLVQAEMRSLKLA